ncbi:ATP-binding protein [Streptomyces sp. MMG1121]|uniref:ATP-binding protein n=1 Tax=Streptomyces sp. MMG1121 TaxID=1415544 RepID=UPI0006BFE26A|nr:ATP-binding protein [Streptomyces sp. MMG1121]KOV56177.1 hypothetical protein ADK64_41585 [Streptomyces sp. MMG1121]
MTPPTLPGDRPSLRPFFSALAVSGALSALVVCAAVAAAPGTVRAPLAWGTGAAAVVLSVAVATAVHALCGRRGIRRRLEAVTQDLGRLLRQQARTTDESRQEQQRLIDELARQRAEFTESFAAERSRLERESGQETDRLRRENARLTAELERARRERATAVSATSNTAGRMQALATATLADLRAMEDRHSDEDVLADLLHLDHRTAQAGRLADSIAVLTGARSGRRWARPIGMESILRGAMGRIAGYQRVRVHSASEAAVAGHAAEGVMHALAELLDNAANFSPPTAEVHVYVEEVPAGVIVSVEDSGLVMGDVQLRRAERAVCGDVSELGGLTGTRLGLAVVGRLARKHGLKVSFRPSARGGTGVLMLIPQSVLTSPAPEQPPLPQPPAPAPSPSPAVAVAVVDESPAPSPQEGPAGLPKRRRGRTLAAAERSRSTPRSPAARPTSGTDTDETRAARFSNFRRAIRPTATDTPATATHRTGTDPAGSTPTAEQGPRHPDTVPDTGQATSGPALPTTAAEQATSDPAAPASGTADALPAHATPNTDEATTDPASPASAPAPAPAPEHTASDPAGPDTGQATADPAVSAPADRPSATGPAPRATGRRAPAAAAPVVGRPPQDSVASDQADTSRRTTRTPGTPHHPPHDTAGIPRNPAGLPQDRGVSGRAGTETRGAVPEAGAPVHPADRQGGRSAGASQGSSDGRRSSAPSPTHTHTEGDTTS